MLDTVYFDKECTFPSQQVWDRLRSFFTVTFGRLFGSVQRGPVRPEQREGSARSFANVYRSQTSRFPYGQIFLSQDQQRLVFVPVEVDDTRTGDEAVRKDAREIRDARYVALSKQEIEQISVESQGGHDLSRLIRKVYDRQFGDKLQKDDISRQDTEWVALCRFGQTRAQQVLSASTLG